MFYEEMTEIQLCHGSKEKIEKPVYGLGNETNDYGKGFYCVSESNIELAKEWACSPFSAGVEGYVNKYSLNMNDLKVLNLDKYDIIYWIVLTARNRYSNVDMRLLEQLEKKFILPVEEYDCIYGWRCDDTYSRIIVGFFEEQYSAEAVREAVHLGYLREQFVLKSKKAFGQLAYCSSVKVEKYEEYRQRFIKRKSDADNGLRNCQRNHRIGKYLNDYLE